MNTWVLPAVPGDAERVASLVRESDRMEVTAASGRPVLERLQWGQAHGSPALTGWCMEGPLCMFGVTCRSVLTREGTPWLLSTVLIDGYHLSFLRSSRPHFEALTERYDYLSNYVDNRHTAAKRWLHWLGFVLGPVVPYGVDNLEFRRFWWSRDGVKAQAHV
jgi:hypothetical protein